MLRMDQVHVIRHKVLIEGRKVRAVARELGVSRNTVRKYLGVSEPVHQEQASRSKPMQEKIAGRVEAVFEQWHGRTTGKQRVTGVRIHRQLLEEGFRVGRTSVYEYLRERRRREKEVFIPLVYRVGEMAEVDFFDVTVDLGGERRKVWKFLIRLMYSGHDFVWLYEHCDQISFFDGHVRAFQYFGGVPERLIYDNLGAAVKRPLIRERKLTERFQALASHYLFEPCFTRPGEGHDKGGVESRGKGIRLKHLVPIPRGSTLEAMSQGLLAEVERDSRTRLHDTGVSVAQRFLEEGEKLRPLPGVPFDPRRAVAAPTLLDAVGRCMRCFLWCSENPRRWSELFVTSIPCMIKSTGGYPKRPGSFPLGPHIPHTTLCCSAGCMPLCWSRPYLPMSSTLVLSRPRRKIATASKLVG